MLEELLGEENAATADSCHSLRITQHQLRYYTSALQSDQHALDDERRLFEEERAETADSYHSLGITQHRLGELHLSSQFSISIYLFARKNVNIIYIQTYI